MSPAQRELAFSVVCVPNRFGRVQLCATPGTGPLQAPPSMGFPRQEYWGGLPLPSPGDFPHPGREPVSLGSPALAGRFFYLGPRLGVFCWHHLFKLGDGSFRLAHAGLWAEQQHKNEVSSVGEIFEYICNLGVYSV